MPKRIQRKRTKGWKMPEGTVYVGRPTQWGNPFAVGSPHPETNCYGEFTHHPEDDPGPTNALCLWPIN